MQMARQRKILTAVLGTGLLALGVDRLVLDWSATTPQSAQAGAAAMVAPGAEEAALGLARDAVRDTGTSPRPSLADRLHAAAEQHGLPSDPARDAFAPSAAWTAASHSATGNPSSSEAERHRFREQHRLMAVMTPGERGVVVVNGQPLRIGRQIAGFTLTSIAGHSATFHGPAGEVVLRLDPAD